MNAPVMPSTSRRDPAVLEQARVIAMPALQSLFSKALEQFDDCLFDRSDRSGSSQMQYLDAMRELRLQRQAMLAAYAAHLEQAWQSLAGEAPLSAERLLSGDRPVGGLSLVDEDELEARLAVRNFASVLGRDCRTLLGRIEQRLAWLCGLSELGSDGNPIGPDHIGVAIHAAFALTSIDARVKVVLFKICERELSAGLVDMYARIDARLTAAGVLPQAGNSTPRRADEPEAHHQTSSRSRSGGGAPQWMRRLGLDEPDQDFDGDAKSTGPDALGPASLLQALHTLLASNRLHERHLVATPGPSPGNRPLSQQEMMHVLTLLQSTQDAGLIQTSGRDDESLALRLKNEVIASAGQLGVDTSEACLGEADEDAIDLVGMLFDVILDERDLPGRSREVIGRLVVPFVKVALLDRRMFVQKTHPARRLLNALAEACEGNAGQTPAERTLLAKVEEITERLRSEFNENLAIFMTLEEEFRDYLAQHRRKVEIAERRAAETQRGQEKLELARRRAGEEVARRLLPDLPTPIADFLGSAWRHHLTLQLLRENDDSAPGVVDTLALADGLLQELSLARNGQGGKPWLQPWQEILGRVFASVGLYGDALETSMTALQDTLQAVAEQRPELTPVLPELPQLVLPSAPAPEASPVELEQAAQRRDYNFDDAQRFRELEIGAWLDFVDKDGKVQAGKLSWISPISARLLFVNRRGVRFCVASPEELAVMVRLGRLRPHENDSTFDAAMMGVIERLDSSPAAVGTVLH